MTWLAAPPKIFLTGGSGFVGHALLARADQPIRALQHSTPLGGAHDVVRGDLLDPNLPWSTWFEGMTHLFHAARPSAGTDRGRRRIAKRTASANETMLSAAQVHGLEARAPRKKPGGGVRELRERERDAAQLRAPFRPAMLKYDQIWTRRKAEKETKKNATKSRPADSPKVLKNRKSPKFARAAGEELEESRFGRDDHVFGRHIFSGGLQMFAAKITKVMSANVFRVI